MNRPGCSFLGTTPHTLMLDFVTHEMLLSSLFCIDERGVFDR